METLSQLVEQLRELTEKGPAPTKQAKVSPVLIPFPKAKKKVGAPASSKSEPTKAGKGQGVAKAGEKRKRKDGTYVKTNAGDWEKVPEKAGATKKKAKAEPAAKAAKKPAKPADKKGDKKPAAGKAKPKKSSGRAKKAAADVKKKNPKAADAAAKALKKSSKGKKPSPEEKKKVSSVAGGIAKSIAGSILKGFYMGRDIGSGKMKDKVFGFAKKAWEKFLGKIDFVESCHIDGQFLFEADSDEADLVKAMQDAEDPDAMLAVISDFMEKEIRAEIEADPEMGQGAEGWEDGDEGDSGPDYPFEPNPSFNPAGW